MRKPNIKAGKQYIAKYRWLRIALRGFAVLVVLFVLGYFVMAWYVHNHRKELLASITKQLNESLNGTLTVGSMDPALLSEFPRVSLNLKEVVIRDSLYDTHKNTLLNAADFKISINTLAMLRGAIEIKKISISNAEINLFTDDAGYSNTSAFKKSQSKVGEEGGDYPELRQFALENVRLKIDNAHRKKLYEFHLESLKGNMDYNADGWEAAIKLSTLAKSMAFNTNKGSFIKDRMVEGNLDIVYNTNKEQIAVSPGKLDIGGEEFTVSAQFQLSKMASAFAIHLNNDAILWRKASGLLSPNISSRLDQFNLKEPIAVSCDIVGDLNEAGDPLIHFKAKIRDNFLETPEGNVDHCSFDGEFTNNHKKKAGFTDANSAILFHDFKGDYAEIPINMNEAAILNLDNPIATGDFRSEFDIEKINNIVDRDVMVFSVGKAKVNLRYTADIENYKLTKPIVQGKIDISGAAIKYVKRNLSFKNVAVNLEFKKDDLFISNIHLRSGKSVVDMEGSVYNFLNLYYTAPEKMVLQWEVNSPQLYLGEFMGFLNTKKQAFPVKRKSKRGNFSQELNVLFDKSQVNMKVRIAKLHYNKFSATGVQADIVLVESGISIKNAGLRHAGGNIRFQGALSPKGNTHTFAINTVLSHLNVREFFRSFNSFGLASPTAENIKGSLSAKANLSGTISDKGNMQANSMYGNVVFNLQEGALIDFAAIRSVGKFAFPFRDMKTISIAEMDGIFDIAGEKVTISPMQVNSSILNMDLQGVYSFGKGTRILVDVPIRNPKKDEGITDEAELAKRRNRGIVLHLVASDGPDGKVKVGLRGKKSGIKPD